MPFLCDGADFDGTNDYLGQDAVPTGLTDGKQGTISFWFRMDAGDSATQRIFNGGTTAGANRLIVNRQDSNVIRIQGNNAAGTTILLIESTTTVLAGSGWHHLAASWDLAVPGSGQLYLDGVSDYAETTYTDDTIEYAMATPRYRVGAALGAGNKLNGALAEFWFNDTRVDLSASLTAFRKTNGTPEDVGADGSTPTGAAPVIYLHLDDAEAVANFADNRASTSDFTITGTLETSDTSPSDGQEPVANFSATPVSGGAPQNVQFTDLTTNEPTTWLWDFGDGGTSTVQNPSRTYASPGTYNVELTATSNAGTDVETKLSFITLTGGGSSRKKRKGKVIRYSDFETREEYAQAVMAAIEVRPPPGPVPEPVPIDEDDDAILIALARILH